MPALKIFSSIQITLALLIDGFTREGALALGWGSIPKQLIVKVGQEKNMQNISKENKLFDIIDTRCTDYTNDIHVEPMLLKKVPEIFSLILIRKSTILTTQVSVNVTPVTINDKKYMA